MERYRLDISLRQADFCLPFLHEFSSAISCAISSIKRCDETLDLQVLGSDQLQLYWLTPAALSRSTIRLAEEAVDRLAHELIQEELDKIGRASCRERGEI